MRIHVQNGADDGDFAVTAAMFDGSGHSVSIGTTQAAFDAAIGDAEALIVPSSLARGLFPCDAPQLRLIFCTSAGLEKLAPYDWLPQGVTLLNNSGVHSGRAGEYSAMALLMLAGQMPALITAQHEQRWDKRFGSVLRGRHVGILGVGDLGAAAARQARHFGMRTTGIRARPEPHPDFDRIITQDQLDDALPGLEFLLVAAPLTPATAGMITRARLQALPQGAGVINIGRGAIIDQDALCDLLDSGHLGGAVIDVFVPEPISPGHRLWTTRNLVVTPHCAADDPNTYAADSVRVFLANVAALREGRALPNRFDTIRGY
jgi:phosphoglycerate dehydrogenase-like enzyme